MYFKLWFMTYGIVITGWVIFAIGLIFLTLAIWEKGRNVKLTAGLVLVFFAIVIFIYLIAPFNWVVVSNAGGL